MKSKVLFTDKFSIQNTLISEQSISDLEEGEVLLKIDKYALTSNNVTYAVIGHQIKYWNFFPGQDSWGIVPVWGFAHVTESRNDDIKKGETLYGYFPMAEFLKVIPGKISDYSFMDISSHRQGLAPIYNTYQRESHLDYKGLEDYIPIIRPLFYTSFLINEFLINEKYFDAQNVVLSSASSKTALSLACFLHNSKSDHNREVIGLTSEKNMDFVKSTGFYDQVIGYDEIESSLPENQTVGIDFSGSATLNQRIYQKLNGSLTHLCKVGLTDWTALDPTSNVPNSKFFFAPDHAQTFFKTHGPAKATALISKSMMEFISFIQSHIEIEFIGDYTSLQSTFVEMIKGKVDPKKGYIFKEN